MKIYNNEDAKYMKCYKKKRKYYIITFMMFIVYLMSAVVCNAESQPDTCYIIFKNSEENNIYIELGQQQILFTNTTDLIDLGNLEFLSQDINIHYSFSSETSDLETLTAEAREYLLSRGYAKLINLDIATDGEKKSQQYAQEMKLGIWEPLNTTEIINLISEKWQALCLWVKEEKELILSILGCGILAALGRAIFKSCRTKKKTIFFGGANSARKTTMSRYLLNPDASREDLLNQEPSLKLVKERIVRDDTNRKLTLIACLLDSPGHELGYIIDELSLTLRARILRKRYAIIIMVAATKSNENRNEIDRQYISDQLITISKLWYAVLKAKRTVKPRDVILFINKLDLYDDKKKMISEFSKHSKQLEQICNELDINFTTISGSVLDKSGMTELMKILKK